jgi:2-succinyl-5-enolpyruvyl-6-hydroxy-3-cyclohexene-1-carboxylate synthase
MTRPNPSTALAEVVVDELFRNGVRLIAISPGSRSGALAIAAASHPDIKVVVVLDERSAAFHALGRAKATGAPAAVISTSGTAPANWFPAVVEADMAMTPLVLVSADRPSELRGIGANQTIDQVHLFGNKVRSFVDISADGDGDLNAQWRHQVATTVGASLGGENGPGPVHLNIGFREPTVPVEDDGRSVAEPFTGPVDGRPGGRPWVEPKPSPAPDGPGLTYRPRGLVIAGDGDYDRTGLLEASSLLGWPVLATAASGLRGPEVIDSYHHILAGSLPEALRPDVTIAVGRIGPSPRLESLFAEGRERVRVDSWGRSIDSGRNATLQLHADPVALLGRTAPDDDSESSWSDDWQRAAALVRDGLIGEIESDEELSGPGIAHVLSAMDWNCLVVASSLPIRDVDAHMTRQGSLVSNRGASGIDGFVSTALGASSARPATVAFVGDLGLLHDQNGFLIDARRDLTLVVMNNRGGGLFDGLPQAVYAPEYERLFVADQHRDLAALARLHGLGYSAVASPRELDLAMRGSLTGQGIDIIDAAVDRGHDQQVRRALDEIARSLIEAFEA